MYFDDKILLTDTTFMMSSQVTIEIITTQITGLNTTTSMAITATSNLLRSEWPVIILVWFEIILASIS